MARPTFQDIAAGLDAALEDTPPERVSLRDLKLVVFSDHHRGAGDRADDFRNCRRIYHAALAYYLELGHRLALLGDVEELWERPLGSILRHYEATLELEQRFFAAGRGVRILGNHDESLAWPWHRSDIEPFLCGEPLREGLLLELMDDAGGSTPVARLFLAHGHQGIGYTAFDRFVVGQIWARLQKLTGWTFGVTPSQSHELRQAHELALYQWAAVQASPSPFLFIGGHTHQPVFMSSALDGTLRDKLAKSRAEGDPPAEIARMEAELYWLLAEVDELRTSLPQRPLPCYFNTGCCCFEDGSITGIEIDGGQIRLVRWRGIDDRPVRQVIREASLARVLRTWTDAAPAE